MAGTNRDIDQTVVTGDEDKSPILPGEAIDTSDERASETVDWVNDFDDRCRGPKWRQWKKTGQKAFDFFRGRQQGRKNSGVLFMIFNVLRMRILAKLGSLMGGKPVVSVEGAGISNDMVGQAMGDLVDTTNRKSDFSYVLSDAMLDTLICGLGVLREGWDYDILRFNAKRGWIRGNFSLTHRDPLAYAFPPDHHDERMSGDGPSAPEGYTFEEWVSRKKLMEEYPHFKLELETMEATSREGKDRRSGGTYNKDNAEQGEDTRSDKLRLVEAWYYRNEPQQIVFKDFEDGTETLALHEDGTPVEPDEVDDLWAAEDEAAAAQGVALDYKYRVHVVFDRVLWNAVVVERKKLLYKRRTKYKHGLFPDVFICGTKYYGDSMPSGEAEHLFTGSELVNTIVSLVVDNLARTNNQGKIVDPLALKPQYRKNTRRIFSTSGFYVESLPGKSKEVLFRDVQTPVDTSALNVASWVLALFDEMSLHADVQSGKMPYQTSGRGIRALQGGVDMLLEHLRENLRFAITQQGRMRLHNLQQFLTVEDRMRISGDYRDYKLGLELFTPPDNPMGGAKMSLVRYEDGKSPDAGGRERLVDDFEALQFDVVVGIKSDVERDPAERRETAAFLQDKGVVTPEYVAREFDVPLAEFKRAQERLGLLQMKAMVDELSKDEVVGPFLKTLLNPDTAGQGKQMLTQMQQALAHLQSRALPAGQVPA